MTLNLRYSVFWGEEGECCGDSKIRDTDKGVSCPCQSAYCVVFWERWFFMTLNKEGKDDIPPVGDFVNFLVSVFM